MRWKLVILFSLFLKISSGQDIHFSQNFVERMYFNPALVGDLEEFDYRVSMQRKSQWTSVTQPFSTFSTSFESKNIYKNLNLGVQFLNDKSGDSEMTLNQLNVAISKNYKVLKVNSFSIGAIVGLAQKTIDYSNLIFEGEEDFLTNSFLYPDIGIGLNYKTNPFQILSYKFGISSFHLNNPNNSFNEDESVNLPFKNNFNFGIDYQYSSNILFQSDVVLTTQVTTKEVLIGTRAIVKLEEMKIIPMAYYRVEDALIFGFRIEKNNIQANISYDINTSDLTTASNNKGGFEFSIIYLWKEKKRKVRIDKKEEKCPKYL